MVSFSSSSHHVEEQHCHKEVDRICNDKKDNLMLDVEEVDERRRWLAAVLDSREICIETLSV